MLNKLKKLSKKPSYYMTALTMLLIVAINTKMVVSYMLSEFHNMQSIPSFMAGLFLGLITPAIVLCGTFVALKQEMNNK